jgi:hypothetical protein
MKSARIWQSRPTLLAPFLVAIVSCLVLTTRAQDLKGALPSDCPGLMASISKQSNKFLNLDLSSSTRQRIETVRSELRKPEVSGVVVYAFVSTEKGIAVIRFESFGSNAQFSEEVVVRSKRSAEDLRQIINAARQEDNVYYRTMLQDDYNFGHPERDQGKLVFLMDTDALGVVPQSFDLPDSVVFASPSLTNAVSNFSKLSQPSQTGESYAALFGLPRTESEYVKVFGVPSGNQRYAPLSEWLQHSNSQEELVRDHQLRALKANGTTALDRKVDLLHQLEAQMGVVMIVAHAEGAEIRVSDTETIRLTPKDIAGLHFNHSPFVFLRVCQGKDEGFANAFLTAGAAGVWANRGPVGAGIANRQAAQFLEKLQSGMSILSTIKQIMATDSHAKNSDVLFTYKH